MFNFEKSSLQYRDRVRRTANDLIRELVRDYLLKGGEFEARKISDIFNRAVRTAMLIVDLGIGIRLDPLKPEEEEKNDKNFIKKTNTESHITRHSPCRSPRDRLLDLQRSRDDIGNIRSRNTEGPPGSFGNEGRVRNPNSAADQVDDNGPARGGEVNSSELESAPPGPRPGERGGYVGGPSSTEVHTPADDRPKRAGPGVPFFC